MCIHLENMRLERCGFESEELVALVAEQRGAVRLLALTPAARVLGLQVGMTATEARARVPEIVIEALDDAGESDDREALRRVFEQFSDRVHSLGTEDIVLAVGRSAHLFGGEAALTRRARELAAELGHEGGCVVISDDPLGSSALAGWSDEDRVVPPGGNAEALAPLPMAALRPSEALMASLRALGVRRVGEFAVLDPASVAGRFGVEGGRLHAIARGVPRPEWVPVARERGPIREEVLFGDGVTDLAPIHFVLPGVLAVMSQRLTRRGEAAVRLAIRLSLEHAPARCLRVRLGRPTASASRMEVILKKRLEDLKLSAPVMSLSLEVEESVPDSGWQPGLLDRVEQGEELPDLLARLTDALGEQAVFGSSLVDEWLPEEAWGRVNFGQEATRAPTPSRPDPVEPALRWSVDLPSPRPSLLLRPLLIEVSCGSDGAPLCVSVDGKRYGVRRSVGPELLSGAWWDPGRAWERTYWVASLEELRSAWIFRDELGRWYLHGWFD